jgi:arabinofuranan 3-O-arabinosyltransferase
MRVDATSRLRMWGYCLVLTALAFVQAPGRIVGDTKIDLAVDPWGFLARAARLWDPSAAFGQLQNQAYGYFWPMGPFFGLGDLVGLSPWVVQRLWWALLLCVAFVGTVKLAKALGLGVPWTQVVAGFAFALSAHVLTLLGPTSIEAWPTAWAPWVLLPLVIASRRGSVRRGAALSALAVAMCGGVNAVAVSAVLPLAVLWLLTREAGTRRRQLLGWWVLFTLLATVWWWVPLLLLGRYSVPFLDYIENAPITTLPTSLPDILGGTSNWVAYAASQDWEAGYLLGTTPFLLLNVAVVAGAGLVGIARTDNPHRQFLFLGVLIGVVLVGFGYTGPLNGWWAQERLALLDAELAPFRNLHKYDVVLRVALVLGLSHFLAVTATSARGAAEKLPLRMLILASVVSVAGVAVPAYAGRLAPVGSFEEVPDYWRQAAAYLDENRRGVALELPASAFGDYVWGSPRDDILQPLASSPWAVRNVIPLAQPGNIRFLDTITEVVESGRPSPRLSAFLADSGVGHVVIRNDISPTRSDRPSPLLVHQVLDRSPGFTKVAEFGPAVGETAVSYSDRDTRILANRGREAAYAAVEVYEVGTVGRQTSAWTTPSVPVTAGDPATGLTHDADVVSGPTVLLGDRSEPFDSSPRVLTDGLRRRETAFTSVRHNQSATMTPEEPWTLSSVVPNHRLFENHDPRETTVRWVGVRSVRASSAQSEAAALPPVRRDQSPAAAVDGDPDTEWVSRGVGGAVGQWWRVRLERPSSLRQVTVTGGSSVGPPVTRLRLTTDAGHRVVAAPAPGRSMTYSLPDARTSRLEIRAVEVEGGGSGVHFAIAEVELPGVRPERFLATPEVYPDAPDQILLRREQGRPACLVVEGTTICDDFLRSAGEEGPSLRRIVTLADDARYDVELTAAVRGGRAAVEAVAGSLPFDVETSPSLSDDIRGSGLAALDGDPETAWIASPATAEPLLRIRWEEPVALSQIAFSLSSGAPGALPEEVELTDGQDFRTVQLTDGRGSFEELVTDDVVVRFLTVEEAYSFEGGQAIALPAGVGEVWFPGADLPVVDPGQAMDQPCGSGPNLWVNGQFQQTRVEATLEEMMSGDPLPVATCEAGPVTLVAGRNFVRATPSDLTSAEALRLRRSGAVVARPERVTVTVEKWSATERTLRVAGRDWPTLLVVNENINAGWVATASGRAVPAQRVSGWMQGWLLPPGEASEVVLRFVPDRTYRMALLAGLIGLLAVAAAAAVPATGRRRLMGLDPGDVSWLVAGMSVLAGGLLAGWIGFAAMACVVVVGNAVRAPAWGGAAAGGSLLLAGAAHAAARAEGFAFHSLLAQSLALLGLVLAAAALGAKGPEFFRLRIGRSKRW